MPQYEYPDGHVELVVEGGARHRELEAGMRPAPAQDSEPGEDDDETTED